MVVLLGGRGIVITRIMYRDVYGGAPESDSEDSILSILFCSVLLMVAVRGLRSVKDATVEAKKSDVASLLPLPTERRKQTNKSASPQIFCDVDPGRLFPKPVVRDLVSRGLHQRSIFDTQ